MAKRKKIVTKVTVMGKAVSVETPGVPKMPKRPSGKMTAAKAAAYASKLDQYLQKHKEVEKAHMEALKNAKAADVKYNNVMKVLAKLKK